MKKKFKKHKEKIELNRPYLLIKYFSDGKRKSVQNVKILLLDGEKRVVFEDGKESESLYGIHGDLVKQKRS